MTALYGTFVRLQTMSDGGVRLVLDLGCPLADIAALNLMPGAAFGLARITGESTIAVIKEASTPKKKPGPLCLLACTYCGDTLFQDFIQVDCEVDAKKCILESCGIDSRIELDTSSDAARLFHDYIRIPFMGWRDRKYKLRNMEWELRDTQ
jgi:hypothetical protein